MKNIIGDLGCPIEATLGLIGGKYKTLIIWHLRSDKLRFNELKKLISSATPKMLTQQLRELEKDGLIIRVVYPVFPPKVEYLLSEFGKSILPILNAMCNWGTSYLNGDTLEIGQEIDQITPCASKKHEGCASKRESFRRKID